MLPIAVDSNSIGIIATSVIANEVGEMEGKDVFKYSLKRSEKVGATPRNTIFIKMGGVSLPVRGEHVHAGRPHTRIK